MSESEIELAIETIDKHHSECSKERGRYSEPCDVCRIIRFAGHLKYRLGKISEFAEVGGRAESTAHRLPPSDRVA